jgi:hypothetical protein
MTLATDATAQPDATVSTRSLADLWRRLRRSRTAGVVTVALLGFLSLGAWTLSSAPGSNPDADYHLSSIWCTDITGSDLCFMEDRKRQKMVPSALPESRCYAQFPNESAACQPLMTTADGRETMTNRLNSIDLLYPTGFYQVQSVFAGENIEASVITMRLVNAALFIGLNVALWLLIPGRLRQPLVLAWFGTMVPMAAFLIPSTNPSSWAIIGVGSAWVALLGYLEHNGWQRWVLGAMFVLFAGLAASARTDATLFAIASSGVALLATDAPFRQLLRRLWIPAAGVVLAGSVIFFQRGAIGALSSGFRTTDSEGFDWGLLWNNLIETPGLWLGVVGGWPWGSLGWLDTPMPQMVTLAATGVFVAIIGVGLAGASWRIRGVSALMFVMVWAIPLYLLQISGFLVGAGFQSRYILPLIVVLLGLMLLRPSGAAGAFTQRTPLVMMASALTLANSIALHHNIRRYTTGLDERGFNLNADREWWWWTLQGTAITPMLVWTVGTIAFFGTAWVALVWGMSQVTARVGRHSEKTVPQVPATAG